ncbi:MAG: anti-sigma factor [Chloroflexota bacterium]|nr:anti-sigma factor [Chloroflexota bacterium]
MNIVDPTVNDRNDQYYEELLGAAAFGTLNGVEAVELDAYLQTSASARAELAELRMIAGGLSLLADEAPPSPDLRRRIEKVVMADAAWAQPAQSSPTALPSTREEDGIVPLSTVPVPGSKRPTPLLRPWILAAAAALLLAVLAGVVLDRLVLDDNNPDSERESIAFNLTTPIPDLSAALTYDDDDQIFILETENMPPAPLDHVYQVWLIDESGPQPVGVMNQSRFVVPGERDAYQAFAITVEPAPLGSAGPTTEPFFVAPLTGDDAEAS